MRRVTANVVLAVGLLFVPIMVEAIASLRGLKPGVGIDLLLYEPFDYAFFLLALALFLFTNAAVSVRSGVSILRGLLVGVAVSLSWMFLSFLVVLQLHLSRGGSL